MKIKNFALIFLGGLSLFTGLVHYLGSFMGFGHAVSALYLNHVAVDAMQNNNSTETFVPHFMRNTGLMLSIVGTINLLGVFEKNTGTATKIAFVLDLAIILHYLGETFVFHAMNTPIMVFLLLTMIFATITVYKEKPKTA